MTLGLTINMPPKRQSYTAQFKLQVIKYAEENSNRKASRQFQVDESCVRKWRAVKHVLQVMPSSRCSLRGRHSLWSQVDHFEQLNQNSMAAIEAVNDSSSPSNETSRLVFAMNDAIYQNIQTAVNLIYSVKDDKLDAKKQLMKMFVEVIEETFEDQTERQSFGRSLVSMGNELRGVSDVNDCDNLDNSNDNDYNDITL